MSLKSLRQVTKRLVLLHANCCTRHLDTIRLSSIAHGVSYTKKGYQFGTQVEKHHGSGTYRAVERETSQQSGIIEMTSQF